METTIQHSLTLLQIHFININGIHSSQPPLLFVNPDDLDDKLPTEDSDPDTAGFFGVSERRLDIDPDFCKAPPWALSSSEL